MNATFRHLHWTALALFALVGCDTAPTPTPEPAVVPATTPGAPEKDTNEIKSMPVEDKKAELDKAEVDKGTAVAASVDSEKLSEKEIANIKKLPADEQTIAMTQIDCPVGGGHLGGMGMPIRQEIDGKVFFICCDGCVDEVKNNPATVLAKLKK